MGAVILWIMLVEIASKLLEGSTGTKIKKMDLTHPLKISPLNSFRTSRPTLPFPGLKMLILVDRSGIRGQG